MYWITLIKVAGAFGAGFLFIFLLHIVRVRKDRARSEAAQEAAAVERFKEVFGISPHDRDRAAVVARFKTVVSEMNINIGKQILSDPSCHDDRKRQRDAAVDLARQFNILLEPNEMRHARIKQRRLRRRFELAISSRQTGTTTNSAA